MGCKVTRDENGLTGMIVCSRGGGKGCEFCDDWRGTRLCDFRDDVGATCDARMCVKCATQHGEDADYCPKCETAYLAARHY